METSIQTEQQMQQITDVFEKQIKVLLQVEVDNKNMKVNSKSDIKKSVQELRNLFRKQQDLIREATKEKPKSWSQVVAGEPGLQIQKPKAKHVVVIIPTAETTSNELGKKIKSKVNTTELNIQINNVRNISKNGILVECNNSNDCEKLKKKINDELVNVARASIPEKRNPRMIIYNLEHLIEEEEFIRQLIEKNPELIAESEEVKDEIKFKFFTNVKNNTKHGVIECTPRIRNVIIKTRNIYTEWSRHNVADFISIIQCYNCFKFGHIASKCNSERVCPECSDKHVGICEKAVKCCKNCKIFNSHVDQNNQTNANHSALDKNCQKYKKIRAQVISRINYDE